ncbi:MAG: COX15/CtaA family protein [Armatimonadetes bacterium]|nr:COX15/CtaA family protein [Armatimonadota bacterium]MDW8121816.1 COX15/CtaA family protein [Armatimonadota bacterium]
MEASLVHGSSSPQGVMRPKQNSGLRFVSLLAAAMSVLLIGAGALVTTTGSGDAIPDWPLSYQRLIPPYLAGGVLYEWSHRVIAGLTGLTVLILTVLVWWWRAPFSWRFLTTLALIGILIQAVLGGLRVLFVSDEQIQSRLSLVLPVHDPESGRIVLAIGHAVLAQLVLSLVFSTAVLIWGRPEPIPSSILRPLLVLSFTLMILMVVQLLLGALIRHLKAGLIIPDFPTTFGRWIPPIFSLPYEPTNPERMTYSEFAFKVFVHLAHRFNAILVLAVAIGLVLFTRRHLPSRHTFRLFSKSLSHTLLLQIILGGFVIWTGLNLLITILHTVIGALALGLSAAAVTLLLTSRQSVNALRLGVRGVV